MICLGGRDLLNVLARFHYTRMSDFVKDILVLVRHFNLKKSLSCRFLPIFNVRLNHSDQIPYPILLVQLSSYNLCAGANDTSIRLGQCRNELSSCQFFDRDGVRPRANGMDTRSPEGLVGGE